MRLQEVWERIIKGHAGISERVFLAKELESFKVSKGRQHIINGRMYYKGEHDIRNKKRTAIGEGGKLITLENLPNAQICDNKFDDLVDQKVNYLVGKPLEVICDDERIVELFDKKFQRKLNRVARDCYIGGVAYLYPYFNAKGELQFKLLPPESVIPFWRDEEHEELDGFIYFYTIDVYNVSGVKEEKTFVEFYTQEKVSYYKYEHGMLIPDETKEDSYYINVGDTSYNWESVPLVVFKANDIEQPLICRVKCLQDALNEMYSNFVDNMNEDMRNTILVIKNYDGEDLGHFRRNLANYGAVKVRSVDGVGGDVSALHIEVNSTNYMVIMQALRRSIIENGRGFDGKDERMANNPNQMNIQSMYADIDLDANHLEMEMQASLEHLLEFVYQALNVKGLGVTSQDVRFVFNRDLPINEAEVIANCQNSVGIISQETIISNHPWTISTSEEMEKMVEEYPLPKVDDVNE